MSKLLEDAREEAHKARAQVYELQSKLARLEEANARLDARRRQLEEIVASSFARSVKMLSGAQKQLGASQDAAQVVARVEDHFRAMRLVAENAIPASSVEAAIRFLLPHWVRPALVEPKPEEGLVKVTPAEPRPVEVVIEVTVDEEEKPTPLLPPPDYPGAYSARPEEPE